MRRARPGLMALALALAALALAAGCGGPEALAAARGVVSAWFEAVAAGEVEAALALYAAPVDETPRADEMRDALRELGRRGPPEAREEVAWKIDARASDEGTGWFVTLVERVRWRHCTMRIRFVVHRAFGGGGEARILAHESRVEEGCPGAVVVRAGRPGRGPGTAGRATPESPSVRKRAQARAQRAAGARSRTAGGRRGTRDEVLGRSPSRDVRRGRGSRCAS